MASFGGGTISGKPIYTDWPTKVDAAFDKSPVTPSVFVDDPLALDPAVLSFGALTDAQAPAPFPANAFMGEISVMTTGRDFYDKMHVIPREFAQGNVLATQNVSVEVHNAYRNEDRTWSGVTNNAGTGTNLLLLPTFSEVILKQDSFSPITLEVTTQGAPVVDTTIDWEFDVVTIMTPITLRRVVLFSVARPELPFNEILEWRTDVVESKSGKEKRSKLRKNPRQIFDYEFLLDELEEAGIAENILFARQGQSFGNVVWKEETPITASVAIGATSIPVGDTDFGDFRGTGFFVIYESRTKFDVLQATSVATNSITVENGPVNAYEPSPNVIVAPIRICESAPSSAIRRHRVNAQRLRLGFQSIENDISIASTAAFSSLSSKVLLDDDNYVTGLLEEMLETRQVRLDNDTGAIFQESPWDRGKKVTHKTFLTGTREGLWQIRQLLHALSGRQVSFFLPTFKRDLEPVVDLVGSDDKLVVSNVGYFQFARNLQPKNRIRVLFNNGDPTLNRTITTSTELSATQEQLTLDAVWPSSVTVSEIDRIEFVEKVRLDTDRVVIRHDLGHRTSRVRVPVRTVFE